MTTNLITMDSAFMDNMESMNDTELKTYIKEVSARVKVLNEGITIKKFLKHGARIGADKFANIRAGYDVTGAVMESTTQYNTKTGALEVIDKFYIPNAFARPVESFLITTESKALYNRVNEHGETTINRAELEQLTADMTNAKKAFTLNQKDIKVITANDYSKNLFGEIVTVVLLKLKVAFARERMNTYSADKVANAYTRLNATRALFGDAPINKTVVIETPEPTPAHDKLKTDVSALHDAVRLAKLEHAKTVKADALQARKDTAKKPKK